MQNIKTILPNIYPLDKFNVILANGQFPQEKILIDMLNNAIMIICCDGAVNMLESHNIKEPNYIIGDCDSISLELQSKYKKQIIKIPEQNTNDLTKAVELAKKLELNNIIILGATGLREDHTLANISLLTEYVDFFKNISLISDYGIFTVHTGTSTIKTIPKQQISFFTLDNQVEINACELKWPLNKFKLTTWKSGTLNEATMNYLNLKVEIDKKIIVYRAFCLKK